MSHLLIAIGTGHYKNLPEVDQRPRLEQSVASVVELFTKKLGVYRTELTSLSLNPPTQDLKSQLDRWFKAEEREATDWVVLYYTGHAEVVNNNSLYLLTTDYEPDEPVSTAFLFDQLADLIGASRGSGKPRRVRNLLVILDTCFAGQGVANLPQSLRSMFETRSGGAFHTIGAALSRQEASAGALSVALQKAIDELMMRNATQEYFFLEQIVPRINAHLKISRAVLSIVSDSDSEPRFFPNPNYLDTQGQPITADVAQRAILDREFRSHWGPRSRGVEFDHQPGEYFFGRTRVLSELKDFLGGAGDSRTRVVTGGPGAGKSAILSQLVRGSLDAADDMPSLDLAIHAKGATLNAVSARMADVFASSSATSDIVDALRAREKPTRIVVDALDEAAEPARIVDELLVPAAAIPSVRLVVGTRKSQLAALLGSEVIDIDASEYADQSALAEYVEARLLRSREPNARTPYRDTQPLAHAVADRVASRAHPNFLVARLIAEDLVKRDNVVDADAVGGMAFPDSVAENFGIYLSRFGASEKKVRDLLLPLAYAEGQGLPWDDVWARLASAIARVEYTDDDVRAVLRDAGAFILESTEDGRAVFRLFHQALADALREKQGDERIHRAFASTLRSVVPQRAESELPDWFLASRYTRKHLATHAGAAGMLGELLADPLFLLAAEPTKLLRATAMYREQLPLELVAIYEATADHIAQNDTGAAAAYLELRAKQRGQAELAEKVAALKLRQPWRALWTDWHAEEPNRPFARGGADIKTWGVATWDRRPVALIGRADGRAEVWDIALGERLMSWAPDDVGAVNDMALLDAPDGAWLAVTWRTRDWFPGRDERCLIGRTELRTGGVHLEPCGAATALTLYRIDGASVGLWAHDRALTLRRLDTFETVRAVEDASETTIYTLQYVEMADRAEVLSGSDSVHANGERSARSILRAWNPATLAQTWEDGRNAGGAIQRIDVAQIGDRRVVLVSQGIYGSAQIWDPATHALLWMDDRGATPAFIVEHDGETYLAQRNDRFVDLAVLRFSAEGKLLAERVGPKSYEKRYEMSAQRLSPLFLLHGRPTVLGIGNEVRVIDATTLVTQARQYVGSDASDANTSYIASIMGDATRVIAGGVSRATAYDAETGSESWTRTIGERGRPIVAMDHHPSADAIVLTAGGVIHVLDSATGAQQQEFRVGDRTLALQCTTLDDAPTVVATRAMNRDWSVTIRSLADGAELPESDGYGLSGGQQDKDMAGLAIRGERERIRFAFASSYGKVMLAAYPSDGNRFRRYQEWNPATFSLESVVALAIVDRGLGPVLAAGTENGRIAVRNMDDFDPDERHVELSSGVKTLRFGLVDDEFVLAVGCVDGSVRLLSEDLVEIRSIHVGAHVNALSWIEPNRLAVGTRRGVVVLSVSSERAASSDSAPDTVA